MFIARRNNSIKYVRQDEEKGKERKKQIFSYIYSSKKKKKQLKYIPVIWLEEENNKTQCTGNTTRNSRSLFFLHFECQY